MNKIKFCSPRSSIASKFSNGRVLFVFLFFCVALFLFLLFSCIPQVLSAKTVVFFLYEKLIHTPPPSGKNRKNIRIMLKPKLNVILRRNFFEFCPEFGKSRFVCGSLPLSRWCQSTSTSFFIYFQSHFFHELRSLFPKYLFAFFFFNFVSISVCCGKIYDILFESLASNFWSLAGAVPREIPVYLLLYGVS